MFDWIKRNVKAAVIAGINEAVAELAGASGKQQMVQPTIVLCLPEPDLDANDDQTPAKVTRKKA